MTMILKRKGTDEGERGEGRKKRGERERGERKGRLVEVIERNMTEAQ